VFIAVRYGGPQGLGKCRFVICFLLRICELEILSLEIRHFEFRNSKFWISKLKISTFWTRNFEFVNSKQENWSQNGMFLTSHRGYGLGARKKKVVWNLTLTVQLSHPTQVKVEFPTSGKALPVKFPTLRVQKVAQWLRLPRVGECWSLGLIGALCVRVFNTAVEDTRTYWVLVFPDLPRLFTRS